MDANENRLLSVVEHWLPRMEVAGIASPEARAIIDRAGVWESWLATWCAEGERHAELAQAAIAAGHRVTAGEAYAKASLLYHFGQFMAFEDLEAKARAAARKVALFRLAAPLLEPAGELVEAPFEAGVLRGYLRRPAGPGPHPLALIIPGSDSTKEEFPQLECHFLARGMATLSFDGPGQGEGREHGPLRADFGPAVAAMLDAVAGRPGLSGAVGLVGMAFGGFLALRAAPALAGIDAVVSINGFFDLGGFWPSLPAVYRDNMGFTLGGPDVAANAQSFTLEGTQRVEVPALILHGGLDRIFPPSEAQRCADHCRDATLHVFPEGNHVCNNIAWRYRTLVADWLADRLRAARGG